MSLPAQVGVHPLAQNFVFGPEPVFPVAAVLLASFLKDRECPYCNPLMKLRNFASQGLMMVYGLAVGIPRPFRSSATSCHFFRLPI